MKPRCLFLTLLIFWQVALAQERREHFLSYIIPCYNCAATVSESIDSIYQQNLSIPFEVICTDDGSADSTRDILFDFKKKYVNFHVYVHEKNKGGAAARNTCVSHAQGDLIFCLDSDNMLEPNSIQKLVDLLDERNVEAAAFKELRYFTGNKKRKNSWFLTPLDDISDLKHVMSSGFVPGMSGNYLYTKESFLRAGGYPENSGAMDTWGFGFNQCATGTRIAVLPGYFYWHRISNDGYWFREQKVGRNNRNCFLIIKQHPEIFTDKTNQYLESVDTNKSIFFDELKRGRFELVNDDALQELFNALK